MKRILLFILSMLFVATLWAQNIQVSGVITDASDGSPLPGAVVVIKGTQTGDVTDANGHYSISVPADAVLEFIFTGMETQEIAVSGRATINVALRQSTTEVDEVMVVAYGAVKKDSYVGSAGVISAGKLENRKVANVTKALDGVVPGVQATTGSGQPGEGAVIRIRGFGSINSSNNPLYVVDGAPYDGPISAINPEDIASITVLKDASAGALYGARAANGVVMITTKRGSDRDGDARVTLKASWGVASRAVPNYDLLDEKEFLETSFEMFRNLAIYDNGVAPESANAAALYEMANGTNRIFGVNEQYNPYNMPLAQLIDVNTGKVNPSAKLRYQQNWMDEVTAENPLRKEYVATVSGGNEKNKYYVSVGYLNEEGLLKTTSFERISARLNLDSQIYDWLKIGGSANVAFNKTENNTSEGSAGSNVWYVAQNMAPIYPVYEVDANGKVIYEDGKPKFDYGLNRPTGAGANFNTVATLYEDKYYNNADNLTIHGYSEIGLNDSKYGWAEGLGFKIDINATNYNQRGTTYYNPLFGNAVTSGGRLDKTAERYMSYTFNQLLTYNRTFGSHTVDVLGGHEFYSYKQNRLQAQKTGFPFPGLYELNPGSTLSSMSSYENNYRIESFLARLKYSYASKYNIEGSFRTDGTSRFHTDSRWGKFWSVGANWRISNEDFMKSISWLDGLSLRASYGVQGNDNLLDSQGYSIWYAWQAFYGLGYNNAAYTGSALASLESKGLRWEKNANFNAGFDTRLFDRLSVTAEFFHRNTTDMLLAVPMATSLGFDSYNANVGSMYNQGMEFSVGVDVIKTANFDWKFTVMGTSIKNRITKLATDKPIIDGSSIYKEGEPIYSYYLPQSAGVDPATGKQLYYVWDKRDPVTDERAPDSPVYISSDVAKAANSRVAVSGRMPKLYGSIGSEFIILRNIDVSFLTTYSIGGQALVGMYQSFMDPLYAGAALHANTKRAWKQPGDITDVPRLEINSGNRTTTSHLINSSFFAIRNITVGYTLPKTWTKRIGVDNLRIYATADNLHTFTYLDGYDPQQSLTGAVANSYVPIRMISGGININF